MGKLYHNERIIDSSTKDVKEAIKGVNKHLKKRNINDSYYMRVCGLDNGKTMFDYGSHSDFYYFED